MTFLNVIQGIRAIILMFLHKILDICIPYRIFKNKKTTMKRFFTILSILFFSAQAFSQATPRGICGNMPSDAAMEKLMASKALYEKLDIIQIEGIKYIPIKFHLIAKTDGTGRVKEYNLLKQLCVLNEDYSNTEFQFYLKDASFSYYNSTPIYETPRSSQLATNQMSVLSSANHNAINVFIVKNIGSGQGGLGTVLGYYDPAKDWVVMLKNEAQSGTNTLSHELGHFFSLAHTFYGWYPAPFQPGSPGWPIAPTTSPDGPLTENQDGSNCENAADKICGKCLSLQTKSVECVFVTADKMCRSRVFCHCRQNVSRVCVCYSRQEV